MSLKTTAKHVKRTVKWLPRDMVFPNIRGMEPCLAPTHKMVHICSDGINKLRLFPHGRVEVSHVGGKSAIFLWWSRLTKSSSTKGVIGTPWNSSPKSIQKPYHIHPYPRLVVSRSPSTPFHCSTPSPPVFSKEMLVTTSAAGEVLVSASRVPRSMIWWRLQGDGGHIRKRTDWDLKLPILNQGFMWFICWKSLCTVFERVFPKKFPTAWRSHHVEKNKPHQCPEWAGPLWGQWRWHPRPVDMCRRFQCTGSAGQWCDWRGWRLPSAPAPHFVPSRWSSNLEQNKRSRPLRHGRSFETLKTSTYIGTVELHQKLLEIWNFVFLQLMPYQTIRFCLGRGCSIPSRTLAYSPSNRHVWICLEHTALAGSPIQANSHKLTAQLYVPLKSPFAISSVSREAPWNQFPSQ